MNLETETTNPFKMINSIYLKLKPFLQMTNLTLKATFFNEKINSVKSTYYTYEEFVSFSSTLSEI